MQKKHRQAWGRRRQCFPGTGIQDHASIIDFRFGGQAKNILKAWEWACSPVRAAPPCFGPGEKPAAPAPSATSRSPPPGDPSGPARGHVAVVFRPPYVTKSNKLIQNNPTPTGIARPASPPFARASPYDGPPLLPNLPRWQPREKGWSNPAHRAPDVECAPHPLSPWARRAGIMRRVGHLSSI
ncbi:hypothetical protein NH44784_061521 [Achromobacter xylosoxidans NH44784-1996]|nr:hypothetical protein NH44784_061521 [Achromobacter xylosoxidans NH44784-1996]